MLLHGLEKLNEHIYIVAGKIRQRIIRLSLKKSSKYKIDKSYRTSNFRSAEKRVCKTFSFCRGRDIYPCKQNHACSQNSETAKFLPNIYC